MLRLLSDEDCNFGCVLAAGFILLAGVACECRDDAVIPCF